MDATKKVSFARMQDSTLEDYVIVKAEHIEDRKNLVPRVLEMLEKLKTDGPYLISRYTHSLQSATLAHAAGESEEMIVSALLHDIGDSIAPENHSALTAAVLQPYVSEKTHWIVLHHGLFQSYYYLHHFGKDRNARDVLKDHPFYQACVDFCAKYDQVAFDLKLSARPLDFFMPMVRRIFAREPYAASGTAKEGRSVSSVGYVVTQK